MRSRFLIRAVWLVHVGAEVAAQSAGAVIAAVDGGRSQPIARYDGRAWIAACATPAGNTANLRSGDHVTLAVTGVTSAVARPLTASTPQRRTLDPAIRRLFDQRAREQSVTAGALAAVPLTIESVHGSIGMPGVYFFAASKSVPDGRGDVDLDQDGEVDPPGTLRVDVAGWLRAAADRVMPLGTNATLSWEQDDQRSPSGTRRSQLEPLGVAGSGDAAVWVMQGRVGELRWFEIYSVGTSGVRRVMRTDTSSC